MNVSNTNKILQHQIETYGQRTKFIRVRSQPGDRFVEFDFAIGSPELFVELIMPPHVFEKFCAEQSVVEMTEEQIAIVDAQTEKWRYGEETLMSKNHNNE